MSIDLYDRPGCFVALVILGLVAFLMLLLPAINRSNLPGALAEIEQVRSDIQKVDASKAEDVVGQAVELNRMIVNNQRYNQLWWAGWAIPDAWDNVKPIEINSATKGGQ